MNREENKKDADFEEEFNDQIEEEEYEEDILADNVIEFSEEDAADADQWIKDSIESLSHPQKPGKTPKKVPTEQDAKTGEEAEDKGKVKPEKRKKKKSAETEKSEAMLEAMKRNFEERQREARSAVSRLKNERDERDKEISELKSELKEAEKYRDILARVQADFHNYKLRNERMTNDLAMQKISGFLKRLLPVIDHVHMARRAFETDSSKEQLKEGIEMVFDQFSRVLKMEGVNEIEAEGAKFDPSFHEAFLTVDTTEHEPETIVEEFRKGYIFNDKLLRPALVSVAENKEKAKTAYSAEKNKKTVNKSVDKGGDLQEDKGSESINAEKGNKTNQALGTEQNAEERVDSDTEGENH